MATIRIPGRFYRAGEIGVAAPEAVPSDGDERRVTLAFSSEQPVVREYQISGKATLCLEVLGHSDGEVDFTRLEGGRAPLLVDHVQSVDSQVGVVERFWIENGRGYAVVRFGQSARASEILARVRDGELSGVSVGYEILELTPEPARDGMPVLRARWRPYEITLCPVPADATVGVGRSADGAERELSVSLPDEEQDMTDKTNLAAVTAPAAPLTAAPDLSAERARVRAIRAMGKRFDMPEEKVDAAIEDGRSETDFQKDVLDQVGSDENTATRERSANIGMTDKEVRRFSLLNVVRYLANPNDKKLRAAAAFEIEASEAAQSTLKRSAQGLLVPADVLSSQSFTRAIGVGTPNTNGAALVATDHLDGSFIGMLRKKAALTRLGVRTLTGLVGNVDIPRQASGATAYWVGENAGPTDSLLGFNTVSLTPHTLAASVPITRRTLIQSTPDIEFLVRDDLIQIMALALDAAGLGSGAGDADAPDGLLDYNIGEVDFEGATPTWAEIVEMESAIATADADVEGMRYVMGAAFRGTLKSTVKAPGTAEYLMQGDEMNGYQAVISNNGPASGAVLGNWQDMILAMWSGLDLTVDTSTLAASGGMVLRAFQDVDFGVRHAESFVHGRAAAGAPVGG